MPIFSAASKVRLASCDNALQEIANEVIKKVGFSVQVGHRDKEDQEKAFAEGRSQKHWPEGEHNKLPSTAFDIIPDVPSGVNVWNVSDPAVAVYWWKLAYCMLRTAERLNKKLRWGNDWNSDGDVTDTKLKDWPHWELV